jgi:hypothetical protein
MFEFICGDKRFHCSHKSWNELRNNIILATIEYLEDTLNTTEEIPDHEVYNHDYYALHALHLLEQFYKETKDTPVDRIVLLSKLVRTNMFFINALTYFGIIGLYELCYKTDGEGHYSPGNALNISLLLDKIEPYLQKKEEIYYFIYLIKDFNCSIYDVVQESYQSMQNIKIL